MNYVLKAVTFRTDTKKRGTFMSDKQIEPRKQLVKTAGQGVGSIAGGVALLVLNSFSGGLGGLILGGIVTLAGVGISTSPEDRKTGVITTAAGIAAIVASLPLVGGLAQGIMTVAGLGLLVSGGLNLYSFFKKLKERKKGPDNEKNIMDM